MRQNTQTLPIYQYSHLTVEQQNAIISNGILSGEIATFDGKLLRDFEHRVADLTGRAHALAVDSGSSALRLALRGLGIGHGHEVIIPEVSWVSVGAAADILGATVRVAPVTDTLTPTWDQIAPLITTATRAVIIAHLRGRPAPGTEDIARHLKERNIALIEDCAQAWGVDVEGRPAGGWGTLATFSTQTFKLIASGEGGAIVGDDADTMALMRAIGCDTREPSPHAMWRWTARMTKLAAGVAIPQLDFLHSLVSNLRELQQQVLEALATQPALTLVPDQTTAIGNGSHVGMRLRSAATAEQLFGALVRGGYRAWWPGPGALHTASTWPVQAAHSLTDLDRYLDVQIPWLPPSEHQGWAAELAAHLGHSLEEAR